MASDFPLGTRWATDLIAAVLPASRAQNVHPLHLAPVANLLYRADMLSDEGRNSLHVRVRAVYKLLERGFDADPKEMGAIHDITFGLLDALQQRESTLFGAAWEADTAEPERRFNALLELYQFSFERFFRSLAAPVVVADGLTRTKAQRSGLVDADGRVTRSVVEQLETGQHFKARALTQGLDNHLRNAKAHHLYDVLGDDSIKLWDVNPRTSTYSWGPVTLSYWELRQRVYPLSVTCYVLLLGLAMFDIAYGPTLRERGWAGQDLKRPRRDVAQAEMGDPAHLHGFEVASVATEGDDVLGVTLRVLDETMPNQLSEIRTSTGERYVREIRTYTAELRSQVYGFIQLTWSSHGTYPTLRVRVVARDGKEDLGEVVVSAEARGYIREGKKSVEEVRVLLTSDTLARRTIPVVHRGLPKRV